MDRRTLLASLSALLLVPALTQATPEASPSPATSPTELLRLYLVEVRQHGNVDLIYKLFARESGDTDDRF